MGDLCLICLKEMTHDSSTHRDTRICCRCYQRVHTICMQKRLKELFEIWDQEPLRHFAGMAPEDEEAFFREHEQEQQQRMMEEINAADASAAAASALEID